MSNNEGINMETKQVVIIGGGIAGLSAGVYALRCGFQATILESHSLAGGNCTSWKRDGYLFEGGMHWLTGSSKAEALNKLWRTVGALDDSVAIHTPEPFFEYDHQGTPIRFYRDIELTEKHLLEVSPDDKKEIKAFCNNVRKVKNLVMPITDIRGVKVTRKQRMPLSLLFAAISSAGLMRKFSKISRDEYIGRFKHPGLRELLRASTDEVSAMIPLFFTLGILARGDGGFPEGGSLPFARRITQTFKSQGGELLLKTRADQVVVEDGRAVGVQAGENFYPADAVIITSDTMVADQLFDKPLHSEWLERMRETTVPTMATLISLGINADMRKYFKGLTFKLPGQITMGDLSFEYLNLNNYADDPTYSPEGKTAMTMILPGDSYDFWKSAREQGNYAEQKQHIADQVIAALAVQIPETAGKVEVCDVATPLTYERYCGNWRGSWMTEMTPSMNMNNYPAAIDGLAGVYFAGQRMTPPGGLPVALMSGRTAVQYLCRDTGTLFISGE